MKNRPIYTPEEMIKRIRFLIKNPTGVFDDVVNTLESDAAKLTQVKALLDGVGPVVDKANRLVSAIDNDSVNCYCDDIEDEIICPFTKFVRQVQEVLKGE